MLKRIAATMAVALVGCGNPGGGTDTMPLDARPADAGDSGINTRDADVLANDTLSNDGLAPIDTPFIDGGFDVTATDTATTDVLPPSDTPAGDTRLDAVTADAGATDATDTRVAVDVARDTPITPTTYVTVTRTITSSAVSRSFVLARPSPMPATPLRLVFSLHGDGGNGNGMRAALPLEARAMGAAVFVYPNAPGGSFEYWAYAGRTREAQFIRDVIDLLVTEIGIDRGRVFLTGFSGGATMSNALACRLGPAVIHGVGIHSGTLYSLNDPMGTPEFTYTSSGGVSCALPPTILVWGQNDNTSGVSYTQGQGVRDNYRATQACASTSTAWTTSPCISYNACTSPVVWCPIAGMGHSIWPGAAGAIWSFFSGLP